MLVHPGPTILPELYGDDGSGAGAHPKLVEFGMKRMRDLGVEVMARTKVAAATPDEVHLSNGERRPDAHDHLARSARRCRRSVRR